MNNISCRIGPGITGLLGANGAGKSTIIKLASGQLRPTQGRVQIGTHDAWSTAAKHHLGYSPDVSSFYEEMTGHEFVYTMARLHGYSRAEARQRTDDVLEEVGMADRAGRRLAGCSHGMRQRIKLAQALVHDPWLLLLDEPHDRHRSGRAAGNQRTAVSTGRSEQDDPRFQPYPGRDRAALPFDTDDLARTHRGFGNAGRSARVDEVSAASGGDRGRTGPAAGGAGGRISRCAGRGNARRLAGGAHAQPGRVLRVRR